MTVSVHGRACVRGIDVSRWQGAIDWQQVAQVRDFAVIKASGGDGGIYADSWYATNRARSAAAGIVTGAYHFLGAYTSGAQQARRFLEVTSGYTGHELPPTVDVEHHGTPTHVVDAFLAELERYLPRRWVGPTGQPVAAMIYTGAPMAGMISSAWARMDLWLAAYLSPTYPRPGPDVTQLGDPGRYVPRRAWSTWSLWQWAGEDGRTPGVPGACDQNVATTEWWARTLGTPPTPPPTPNPLELTVSERSAITAALEAITARLDAIDAQLDPVALFGGWLQESRALEGLAALKLPEGDEQYLVTIVNGVPHRRHLTPEAKAGLQLAGQVQVARIPTGTLGEDGTPEVADYIEVTGQVAEWLRGLPAA